MLRPCNPEQLFRAGTLLKLEMKDFDDLANFVQITVENNALILDLRGEQCKVVATRTDMSEDCDPENWTDSLFKF